MIVVFMRTDLCSYKIPFLHPFHSKGKMSLHSMNLTIFSIRIDVIILYVAGRYVMGYRFLHLLFSLLFIVGNSFCEPIRHFSGSLFNGISTFVSYLMPELFFLKNSRDTI